MASTIPAAIDGLVALATAACPAPVMVFDGYPTTDSPQMVVIGGDVEPSPADGSVAPEYLGRQLADENYHIGVVITCWTGDVDQKSVRDQAFALYDQIRAALRATPLAGGLIAAYFDPITLHQTTVETAEQGRRAVLTTAVNCQARQT